MMKENKTVPEKSIVIDLKLSRGLVVALSCVLVLLALLAGLTLTGDSASASESEAAQAASAGMRLYYLTPTTGWFGNSALDACVDGYHMASLWEITEPSGLKYNTVLGLSRDDSGQGPPRAPAAWVRTGYANDVSDNPGQANCDGWNSDDGSDRGSVVQLTRDWTGGTADVGVWEASTLTCNVSTYVWCIQD
jgi:hypothetical protein